MLTFILYVLLAAASIYGQTGKKLYWTAADKIQRSDLDGSNVEDVITVYKRVPGMALAVASGKVYWIGGGAGSAWIQRANLDGSDVQYLVTGLNYPRGLVVDAAGGKMYWAEGGWETVRKIQTSNLEGKGVVDLVISEIEGPRGIALDVANQKMYWSDQLSGKIQRADLDGSDVEDLLAAIEPTGIALDAEGAKLYWIDNGTGGIHRANSDGSNAEILLTADFEGPGGIALDAVAGQMYWTVFYPGVIRRADLDGNNLEDVVTGLDEPDDIAIFLPGETSRTPGEEGEKPGFHR